MTTLVTSATPDTKADALVIGVAKGPKGLVLVPGSEAVAAAFGRKLLPTLVALGATGKAEEVTRTATLGALTAPVLVAVGLGDASRAYPHEAVRRAAGAAVRAVAGSASVVLALPAADAEGLRAVAEGALLGAYSFTRFRVTSLADKRPPVPKVVVVTEAAGAKAVLKRAQAVCRAVSFARDLVNTPPSHLHPAELADAAVAEAERVGVTAEVLDEKALKKGGYGGIVGEDRKSVV